MSAIEMMDPKMDAGMNHQATNNGNKKILNFEQAVKANKLQLKNIAYSQLIGNFVEMGRSILFLFDLISCAFLCVQEFSTIALRV